MFRPRFHISHQLLQQIKQINELIVDLNNRRFPQMVTFELEKTAREISAFTSTSIEGNPLPLTEVKKILKTKPKYIRDSQREVLNYNQALKSLSSQHKKNTPFSLDLILKIQQQVTSDLLPGHESGQLRQKPVVVNDPKTGKLIFLPPDVNEVKPLMEELVDFVIQSQGKIDPLIMAGIFHKQFVIIHPFMDGNGRTARLITKTILAQMGLNTFNLFSFESYYNQNVTRYFQTVGESGDYYELKKKIDFTAWLEYFTAGIIDELLRVKKILLESIIDPKTGLKRHHQKILNFIRKNGFINEQEYSKITKRAKSTRAKDFQELIKLGLIEKKSQGKKTFYVLK